MTSVAEAVVVAMTGTMTVVEVVGMAVDMDVTVVMMAPTRVEEEVAGTGTTIAREATAVDVMTEMTATHHVAAEVAGTMVVVTTKVVEGLTELASLLVVKADLTRTVLVVVMTTDVKRLVIASVVVSKYHSCYDVFYTY